MAKSWQKLSDVLFWLTVYKMRTLWQCRQYNATQRQHSVSSSSAVSQPLWRLDQYILRNTRRRFIAGHVQNSITTHKSEHFSFISSNYGVLFRISYMRWRIPSRTPVPLPYCIPPPCHFPIQLRSMECCKFPHQVWTEPGWQTYLVHCEIRRKQILYDVLCQNCMTLPQGVYQIELFDLGMVN